MDAALSGSSISNDDSNSDLVEDIDDDFDMNSPTGSPITVYPYAMQQFPIVEFNKLCEGLYRLPSWMVYPADLATCLHAAVNIVREGSRQETGSTAGETHNIKKLMRDTAPYAFEKCFSERAVYNWGDSVQQDIFCAALHMVELTALKLKALVKCSMPDAVSELEEDLTGLLEALARIFDPGTFFHQHNKNQDVVGSKAVEETIAVPLRSPSVSLVDADPEALDTAEDMVGEQFCWLATLLNWFQHKRGFESVCKMCSEGDGSFSLLKMVLEPLVKAVRLLTPEAVRLLAPCCSDLLRHISTALASEGLEALADGGRDRMFNGVSALFSQIYTVLSCCTSPVSADAKVSDVQRKFVEKLLENSVFNKHLTAVREINNMLQRAKDVRANCGEANAGKPMKDAVGWLVQKDMVQALLRAHLHQRQYVDQVQKVLKTLATEDGLQADHLELLWNLTEKVDTFEAVKTNVYSVLGDLAKDLHGPELDLLFSKFEACTGWPAPDTLKAMDLLKQLAKSDDKGTMAQRVLGLLWGLTFAPGAPAEVAQSRTLSESLHHYASVDEVGTPLVWDYMKRCISQIKTDDNPMALTVLNSLIQDYSTRITGAKQASEFNIVEVVVSSLEAYKDKVRKAAAAAATSGAPADPGDLEAQAAQYQATLQYLTFLTTIAFITGEPLQLKYLQRLWACLVARPTITADPQLAFMLLVNSTPKNIIATQDMAAILTDSFPTLDPASMTQSAFDCFEFYLQKVAFEEGKLQNERIEETNQSGTTRPLLLSRDLDMKGLPYLWRVVLDGPPGVISDRARALLVSLHVNLADNLVPKMAEVRSALLRSCLDRLLAAAHALTGLPGGRSDWGAFSGPVPLADSLEYARDAQRAVRCLAVMQQLVEECQGASMPAFPAHAASFQGQPTHVDVNMQGGKMLGQGRGRIPLYTNDYVGVLRRKVAAKMATQAPHVRLLFSGQELRSDSRLIQDAGLAEGHSIHAIFTPHTNSYTELAPAEADTQRSASPALLLAQQEGFYDVLLCLADFCPVTAVRHAATRLLDMLPTDRGVLEALRTAIASPTPAESLAALLLPACPDGRPTAKPARLLYTLQALNSLLFPVSEAPEALQLADALQQTIITSECVGVMLRALQVSRAAYETDILLMRKLYATLQLLLSRLLKRAAAAAQLQPSRPSKSDSAASAMSTGKPAGSTVTMEVSTSGAAASTASGGAAKPEGDAPSASQGDAPSAAAAAAATTNGEGDPAAEVDPGILQDMLLFFVHLALHACRGWGAPPPPESTPADPSEDTLPEEDARLFVDALLGLRSLLDWRPHLLEKLLAYEGAQRLMTDGLLNMRHVEVRRSTAALLQRLAGVPSGHAFTLQLLDRAAAAADAVPHHCATFYKLFCQLVHTIPDMPREVQQSEVQLAERLLEQLVTALSSPDDGMADNAPGHPPGAGGGRLEGKLKLALALVQTLDRRSIGACSDCGLVSKLLSEYLFPAAALLARINSERGSFSVAALPQRDLYLALNARCSTKASRQAALELVADLMEHSTSCMKEGLQHLTSLHFQQEPFHESDFNIQADNITRQPSGFVGLKNAGATCYMNAVFQQLFMQPSIRALVLGAREEPPAERLDSTFYQLQRMFAYLALSHSHFYKPFGFWKTFKDYDGEPINVREHQDAYEFFTRLQDLVDQHLRGRKETPAMQAVMGGTFAQQIICKSVNYRSEKEEDFYQISLDVRGKKNLEESLDFYCQGELMEGDNQYYCEEVGKKVDAVKRNCIKVLPHTLVIHLKRFEFDYETMTRWKIKDRFEFPQELDMYKYTVDGLAAKEEADAAAATAAGPSDSAADADVASTSSPAAAESAAPSTVEPTTPKDQPNAKQYQYSLKGIVVHSGSAFAGHYYSYIKVRKQEGQGMAAGQWLCFDDNQVEPWDIANLDRDCFGGKQSDSGFGDRGGLLAQVAHEFDRPHSAYMLFYERSEELEPIEKLLQASVPAAPTPSDTPASGPLSKGLEAGMAGANPGAQTAVSARQVGGGGQSVSTVPIPNMAATCPSILEEVTKCNLDEIEEVHLLDHDFIRFLRRLVEANLEACQRKLRRTEPSPTKSAASAGSTAGTGSDVGSAGGSARGSLRPGRNEDMEHVALLTSNLALRFVFMVYLKAHSTLRDDMREWRSALQALYEATPLAARMLLAMAANEPSLRFFADALGPGAELRPLAQHFLENYISRNMEEDVREWVGTVVSDALRFAVRYDGGGEMPRARDNWQPEEGSTAYVIEGLVLELKRAVAVRPKPARPGQLPPRHWHEHVYNIAKAYADLGPVQREHLQAEHILLPLVKTLERYAEHGISRDTPLSELTSLVHLLSALIRRMQHSHEGPQNGLNPYGFPMEPSETVHLCPHDLFNRMTTEAMMALFLTYLLTDREARLLLKWLMWCVPQESQTFLVSLISHVKKARPEDICDCVEEIADMVVVHDHMLDARVKFFLGINDFNQGDGLLLLLFNRDIRNYLRKFVFVRIVLAVAHLHPKVKADVAEYGNWRPIYEGLRRESGLDATHHPLSAVRRQTGFTAEELQDVLTGIRELLVESEDDDISADRPTADDVD
ncbi:probable ubiquitin carboxyl-terminal hydrolase FAF-X [Coccomyxa sp. Obi]|nr:probable ubiquitin carboxyl-terminal hydrolase FAF-X [Coccomyxa sp. Obi]